MQNDITLHAGDLGFADLVFIHAWELGLHGCLGFADLVFIHAWELGLHGCSKRLALHDFCLFLALRPSALRLGGRQVIAQRSLRKLPTHRDETYSQHGCTNRSFPLASLILMFALTEEALVT